MLLGLIILLLLFLIIYEYRAVEPFAPYHKLRNYAILDEPLFYDDPKNVHIGKNRSYLAWENTYPQ